MSSQPGAVINESAGSPESLKLTEPSRREKQTKPLFDVGDEITRVALSTNWMQAINTFDFTNFSQIPHKSIAGFRKAHFTNVV
ncbi:hypothetical protein [Bradyrhizobium sp. DASA03007]|uniref:hypothetical protein n=1 Tax=unclassified Bradyrhizobium TaxID=2631580 RepID=UPI003F6FB9CF